MTEPGAGSAPAATQERPASEEHGGGLRARVRRMRRNLHAKPRLNLAWRIGVGVLGTLVVILGILAIPYPGPGWLIVFAGLGILSTEFEWAARLLRFARRYYDTWAAWVSRQNLMVKLLLGAVTCLVVVASVWLLNGFGIGAGWVGLESWTWLKSPILG